jgi:uncharacterized protein YbcI
VSGTTTSQPPREQSPAARISNHCVRTLSAYTGRGPTKSWTTIDGDLVSIVLRDTLTRGERSLVEDGRAQLVRDMRKAYQQTMREDLVAGVEEITGRKVIAFLSDNHINPDIAIESFRARVAGAERLGAPVASARPTALTPRLAWRPIRANVRGCPKHQGGS